MENQNNTTNQAHTEGAQQPQEQASKQAAQAQNPSQTQQAQEQEVQAHLQDQSAQHVTAQTHPQELQAQQADTYWGNPPQTPSAGQMPITHTQQPPQAPLYPQSPAPAVQQPVTQQPLQQPAPVQQSQVANSAPVAQPTQQASVTSQTPATQPVVQQQPPATGTTGQQPPYSTHPAYNVQDNASGEGERAHYSTYMPPLQQMPYGAPTGQGAQPKKKGLAVVAITGLLVVALLFAAGYVIITTFFQPTLPQNSQTTSNLNAGISGSGEGTNTYIEQLTNEELNEQFRALYLNNAPNTGTLSRTELDTINSLFANARDNDASEHQPGVYYVGETLDPGSYWFNGTDERLTYFTVLTPVQDGSYQVSLINNYYGHNLFDLAEGDVLVIEEDFIPLDAMKETFEAPYESGVYRVGTDIPAGTYRLTAGDAQDYYAYYIMSDLKYEPSSYIEENLYLDANKQIIITVEEGTYLELYNLKATPNVT